MNYNALIQNRKSVREFTDRLVPYADLEHIRAYYDHHIRRLIPELKTELYFFGTSTRDALEGAAGYNQFLVGAPQYLVLTSDAHPNAYLNAGFMMEDLILKLGDLGLDSCWLTFTHSEDVKHVLGIESDQQVVAIAAFGYGKKTTRRLRLNIRSMSDIDISAKRRYMEPKRSVRELAYVNSWGNNSAVYDYIGFFDDMLWEALYAASLAPSYLNRQSYGFLLTSGNVSLISCPDEYNTLIDSELSLGIVMHHFSVIAENWAGKLSWKFGSEAQSHDLPEDHKVIASCAL